MFLIELFTSIISFDLHYSHLRAESIFYPDFIHKMVCHKKAK